MTAAELEQLLPDTKQLSDSIRDRVLALGEAAHAAIVELVRREVQALREHSESNLGWRAHHAVLLAGRSRCTPRLTCSSTCCSSTTATRTW